MAIKVMGTVVAGRKARSDHPVIINFFYTTRKNCRYTVIADDTANQDIIQNNSL
jgi:hypothetical protein